MNWVQTSESNDNSRNVFSILWGHKAFTRRLIFYTKLSYYNLAEKMLSNASLLERLKSHKIPH